MTISPPVTAIYLLALELTHETPQPRYLDPAVTIWATHGCHSGSLPHEIKLFIHLALASLSRWTPTELMPNNKNNQMDKISDPFIAYLPLA